MNKQKTHRSTHPPDKAKQDIPDRVIESLARCALPLIRAYFESEEGRRNSKSGRRTNSTEMWNWEDHNRSSRYLHSQFMIDCRFYRKTD